MATNEEIIAEIEELGRLTEEQELVLYNISLKQDELGRQASNMLLEKVIDSPVFQPMIDRELLTYEVLRYCIMYADEIAPRRALNPAGAPWEANGPIS